MEPRDNLIVFTAWEEHPEISGSAWTVHHEFEVRSIAPANGETLKVASFQVRLPGIPHPYSTKPLAAGSSLARSINVGGCGSLNIEA